MGSDIGRRRGWIIGVAVAALLIVGHSVWSRWPPPQLAVDEQVFTTVDALYTSLTARDQSRLEECEQRLQAYHADGRISDAVAGELQAIMNTARDGEWEPAAKTLYAFILGQRGGM